MPRPPPPCDLRRPLLACGGRPTDEEQEAGEVAAQGAGAPAQGAAAPAQGAAAGDMHLELAAVQHVDDIIMPHLHTPPADEGGPGPVWA